MLRNGRIILQLRPNVDKKKLLSTTPDVSVPIWIYDFTLGR